MSVLRYTGSAWSYVGRNWSFVGQPGLSGNQAHWVSLAAGNAAFYVAFADGANSGQRLMVDVARITSPTANASQ